MTVQLTQGQEQAQFDAFVRMKAEGLNRRKLAKKSGLSVDTVGGFLAGKSWGQEQTRQAISLALGWDETHLDDIAEKIDRRSGVTAVTSSGDATEVYLSLEPDYFKGMSPEQERLARLKLDALKAKILVEVEEIRLRLGGEQSN